MFIWHVSVPNGGSTFRRRGPRAALCAQAFSQATAFNANIGTWNTASVSNMYSVCAPRRSHCCPIYAPLPAAADARAQMCHTRTSPRLRRRPQVYAWLRVGRIGYMYTNI